MLFFEKSSGRTVKLEGLEKLTCWTGWMGWTNCPGEIKKQAARRGRPFFID